jgi:sporulation-control protein spo0M
VPRFLRKLLDRLPSDLPLHVETDKDAYSPGETVEIRVSAGPARKKVSFNYFVIALEQQTQYEYDWDDGDGMRRRTLTDRVPAGEQRFTDARTLARGEKTEWTASLAVPQDEPGTAVGDIIKVRWLADALVPFRGKVDAHADRPLHIYTPLARYARLASRHPDLDTGDEADLTLELAKPYARPGEQLSGTFRIRPLARVEAKQIRIELIRHEHVPIDLEAEAWGFEGKHEMAGETTLEPGHDLELHFTLGVPAEAAPTLDIDAGSIVWSIVATVSRRLHGDLTLTQEITIYDDLRAATEPPESSDGAVDGHDNIEDVFSRPPGKEPPGASAPGTP